MFWSYSGKSCSFLQLASEELLASLPALTARHHAANEIVATPIPNETFGNKVHNNAMFL